MALSIRKIENDTEVDRILNKEFTSAVRTGYVEVGEDKVCLPIYYQDHEEWIRKLEVRDDDVFLFGLAKTGTTWCHEMLWLIVNNLDYEGAKQDSLWRCPMLEMPILYDFNIMKIDHIGGKEIIEHIEQLKSPRCLKSHLHWSLLPEQIHNGTKQPKMISLFRNPKDTCISHYHQARLAAGYKGTFEEFSKLYLSGRVPYGPFWKYVLSFWAQKHRPNILFIRYEEMKTNLPAVIRRVAEFLEKTLSAEQVEKLAQHLSFESMKRNTAANPTEHMKKVGKEYNLTIAENDFIRAGKVGDHQSIMTSEVIEKFDQWTKENLDGTDFTF